MFRFLGHFYNFLNKYEFVEEKKIIYSIFLIDFDLI